MIIDFHTHTFPDKIAGRALTKLSHNSHSKPFTDGTDTGLVRSMKESGIDLSVILPVATDPAQVMGINDSAARRAEERLAEGLVSFGAMHPDYEDWHGELDRIRANGMKGIKIHPVYQGADLDDIRLLRIYDRCAELGLSVVIHMGGWRQWDQVLRLAPELTAAGPVMLDTAFSDRAFVPLPDGYWKEGETAMLESDGFMRIIEAYGAGRILFATDSPWSSQADSAEFVRNLPLSAEELGLIMHGNAEGILAD